MVVGALYIDAPDAKAKIILAARKVTNRCLIVLVLINKILALALYSIK
jgi:hypothetical protein